MMVHMIFRWQKLFKGVLNNSEIEKLSDQKNNDNKEHSPMLST